MKSPRPMRWRSPLCLMLALVLIVGMIPMKVLGIERWWNSRTDRFVGGYSITGNCPQDMINIATAQLGQAGSRYNYGEYWCADFISDCAVLADCTNAIPGHKNVGRLRSNILEAGGRSVRWEPAAGDIIIYDWPNTGGTFNHVELVTSCSGGRVYTIGGNNNDSVTRNNYAVNDNRIYDIVRPNYPSVHTHSYSASVTPPTCTQRGYTTYTCSCGDSYVDNYVPALGHDWDEGTVDLAPTCTATGLRTRLCTRCGAATTEDIPMKDHDWVQTRRVPATCLEPGYTEFKCRSCGKTRTEADSNGYSPWSDQKPQGVPEDQIETRTQYRSSDRITIQDTRPQVPGFSQESFEWQNAGSRVLDYVKQFPSGFKTSHPLYTEYHKSPMTDYVNGSEKLTVTGSTVKGYIYWHWCQNSYAYGPINRFVNDYETPKYPGFHAFFSTTAPGAYATSPADGGGYVYNNPNGDACKDTYWYYALEVTHQTADVYEKLYTHSRWSDWSDWTTEVLSPSGSRKVETRTVYRQKTGEATGHKWVETSRVPTTCKEPGYVVYTCSVCGETYQEPLTGYSEWTEQRPSGVPDSRIQTKTEYRYRDYEKTESADAQVPGYEQIGTSDWKFVRSDYVNYVPHWADGFQRSHPLYTQYHNTPKQNSVNGNRKLTVTGDSVVGYIYWHWCQNSYANGPINRYVNDYETPKYPGFHAFFSTTAPSAYATSPTDDGLGYVYNNPNGDACRDTYWYYATEVRKQTYSEYDRVYVHGRWGGWSQWSETPVTPSDTCQVETRTLYRTWNGDLPEHTWDEGKVTREPTTQQEGVRTYTCTVCGETRTESIPRIPENPYQDVNKGDYFYEPVIWATRNGITSGRTPTSFCPDQFCTRAQAVTFLWRAAGRPAPRNNHMPFRDVPASAYYRDAVLWAMEQGITAGKTDTAFLPDEYCTRAQIVTFLWRYHGKPAVSGRNPFWDVNSNQFYYNAVLWAVQQGITSGKNPTTFLPDQFCSRAQIVTFLYRDTH